MEELQHRITSEELTEHLLGEIRQRYYGKQEKHFYQERNILLMALAWPARWLEERSIKLSAHRYRALILKVLGKIEQHSPPAASIRSFGRYLLISIQNHLKEHGEEYCDEARSLQRLLEDVFHGLEQRQKRVVQAHQYRTDNTTAELAAVHRILSKGARKAAAQVEQGSLFCLPAVNPLPEPEGEPNA